MGDVQPIFGLTASLCEARVNVIVIRLIIGWS